MAKKKRKERVTEAFLMDLKASARLAEKETLVSDMLTAMGILVDESRIPLIRRAAAARIAGMCAFFYSEESEDTCRIGKKD